MENIRSTINFKFQEKKSPSDQIADELGINNVDIPFDDDDYISLNNYKLFKQHVQPIIQKANPKVAMAKMVTLIGAKWREFAQIVAQRNKDKDDGSPSEREKGDTSRDGATSDKEEEVTDTENRDNGMYRGEEGCDGGDFVGIKEAGWSTNYPLDLP